MSLSEAVGLGGAGAVAAILILWALLHVGHWISAAFRNAGSPRSPLALFDLTPPANHGEDDDCG